MEMNIVLYVALGFIGLALVLGILRFIKGPTAADRVVALDTMSVIVTATLALMAYIFQRYIYVDVSLIYAVLGFIGVIVLARYLEKAL
jgi:multicomponent Na+:H+ antiporter subunit F